MSDDSDCETRNDETRYSRTASLSFLSQRLTLISDRKCILFPNKKTKSDYIMIMRAAEKHPEFINDRTPTEPGYNSCEVFVMNKDIKKSHLNLDNFTPWYKGGNKRTLERHHSYYYTRNSDGDFVNIAKESATHILRILVCTLASCPALNKKIYRMVTMENSEKHCLPSLIVYTFESGHQRPVPNLPAVLNREALDSIRISANLPQATTPSTSSHQFYNERERTATPPKRSRQTFEGNDYGYEKNDHFETEHFEMVEPKQEFENRSMNHNGTLQDNNVTKEEIDHSINNRPPLFNGQTSNRSSSSSVVQHSNQRKRFQNYEMFSAGVITSATVPSPMFHPHITPIADVEDEGKYDSEELTQRNKLAALYRLVDLFRWSQGIYNHITVRVSSDPDEILINAFGQLYNEVSASSLIKVDLDGTVIDGGSTGFGVNQAGYVLHSAIHNGRPEVKCVVHLHHPSVVAVSAQKCGLLPISQEAMIVGEVGYHEYRGILIDEAERALLIRDLGERHVMILRNHGFVVCGESIEHALSLTYHLIIACETQIKTVPGGNTDNVHFPAQSAIKQVYKVASNGGGGVNRQNGHVNSTQWRKGELEWQAYMRQLDAQGYVTGHVYN
ncbi:hypothetical protein CAEBREN_31563 [Caenorhabditis brenneri]|uniref:Class II aldolase/adducin N-terminal domain-containing protein n=1 Tax=Caenorhabditis brenneri TaxID=135651 RepID=G0NGV6_CAEBE|nr:hypothetical protein CAEBREN_31563 [Caenorhabditis brenneri]